MKIISVTASPDIKTGGTNLFGLGDDNKIYCWNALLGGWQKNWEEPKPVVQQDNRQGRRAKAKKRG